MAPLPDEPRSPTPSDVALRNETCGGSDSHLPQAAVLPEVPTNLEDVLNAAVERLEDYLLDIYEHGRSIGDPMAIWANGVPYMIREILDCFPLERLTID